MEWLLSALFATLARRCYAAWRALRRGEHDAWAEMVKTLIEQEDRKRLLLEGLAALLPTQPSDVGADDGDLKTDVDKPGGPPG